VRSLPKLRLRALQLAPALVRAHAAENLFDVALTIGVERLPSSWVSEYVGLLAKGLFANPALARSLGRQPVPVEALSGVPFLTPVYTSGGQFIPIDDGCPLPFGERRLGHEVQTMGLALELAAGCDQLAFGPAVAAQPYLASGALVEVRVAGWEITEALHLACNVDRVLARVQRSLLEVLRSALEALPRPRAPGGRG